MASPTGAYGFGPMPARRAPPRPVRPACPAHLERLRLELAGGRRHHAARSRALRAAGDGGAGDGAWPIRSRSAAWLPAQRPSPTRWWAAFFIRPHGIPLGELRNTRHPAPLGTVRRAVERRGAPACTCTAGQVRHRAARTSSRPIRAATSCRPARCSLRGRACRWIEDGADLEGFSGRRGAVRLRHHGRVATRRAALGPGPRAACLAVGLRRGAPTTRPA